MVFISELSIAIMKIAALDRAANTSKYILKIYYILQTNRERGMLFIDEFFFLLWNLWMI